MHCLADQEHFPRVRASSGIRPVSLPFFINSLLSFFAAAHALHPTDPPTSFCVRSELNYAADRCALHTVCAFLISAAIDSFMKSGIGTESRTPLITVLAHTHTHIDTQRDPQPRVDADNGFDLLGRISFARADRSRLSRGIRTGLNLLLCSPGLFPDCLGDCVFAFLLPYVLCVYTDSSGHWVLCARLIVIRAWVLIAR